MKTVAVGVLALALGGCVTKAQMEAKYQELEAEWRVENATPSETPLPLEVKSDLQSKASEWAAAENVRRVGMGAEAAGHFATGNYLMGILSVLGIGSLAYDGYKATKKKGAA